MIQHPLISGMNQIEAKAITPRPYQSDCIDAIIKRFRAGESRVLVTLPTGCGKTIIFASLLKQMHEGYRGIVIAHRKELIDQAVNKIQNVTGQRCAVEMGEQRSHEFAFDRCRFIVSSVQTQCSRDRMLKFDPEQFGLLVIDEAHHALDTNSYGKVIKHYTQNTNLKVLGVTATPDRLDKMALGRVFESVAYQYQIDDAIRDGWLTPVRQSFVQVTGMNLANVKTKKGDLADGELAAVMEQEKVLLGIINPTYQIAGNRKTLIFCASVKHAGMVAEALNGHRNGCAAMICGETNEEDRIRIVEGFRNGSIQFLSNCGVATEGFDVPDIAVVACARPTKSRALYCQMIGRGTRPLDGLVDPCGNDVERKQAIESSAKPYVEVIDFVGNSGKHKLVTTADILGGNYDDDVKERAARNVKKNGKPTDMLEELEHAKAEITAEQIRLKRAAPNVDVKYRSRVVDPFNVFDLSANHYSGIQRTGCNATPNQVKLLENMGVSNADTLSKRDASLMIDTLISRRDKGLCTYKQAKMLSKHGVDTINLTFSEASNLITRLASNGWRYL